MELYAITDRLHAGRPLARLAYEWSSGGVNYIQLREKDLAEAALSEMTRELADTIANTEAKLLVNVPDLRTAAAVLAAGAHGVHLPGVPVPKAIRDVRALRAGAIVSLPCHSLEDISTARREQADLVLFSPVFGKAGPEPSPGKGIAALGAACRAAGSMPVFALGGVTAANASACVTAGAAGVAAIRLFAGEGWRPLAGKPTAGKHI
jgi:thiamine-phosphate pyrophosphorylase